MPVLSVAMAAGLWSSLSAQIDKESYQELFELRLLSSQSAAEWKIDRQILEDQLKALETEKELLNGNIADLSAKQSGLSTDERDLQLKKLEVTRVSAAIETQLVELEKTLLQALNSLPQPLMERIQPLVSRIPIPGKKNTFTLSQRIQNLVAIVSQANKFSRTLTLSSEVRQLDTGKEIMVTTIYVGLTTAFYVDQMAQNAGTGVPGTDGWVWTPKNDLAGDIHRLVNVYEGKADPQFVTLPITLR
jgi:hypothetical protein